MKTIKVMGTGGGLFVMDLTPEVEQKIAKGILTVVEEAAEPKAPKALEKMNLTELRAVCEAEGVDAEEGATKAELVEAIEDARTAPDPEPDQDPEE